MEGGIWGSGPWRTGYPGLLSLEVTGPVVGPRSTVPNSGSIHYASSPPRKTRSVEGLRRETKAGKGNGTAGRAACWRGRLLRRGRGSAASGPASSPGSPLRRRPSLRAAARATTGPAGHGSSAPLPGSGYSSGRGVDGLSYPIPQPPYLDLRPKGLNNLLRPSRLSP